MIAIVAAINVNGICVSSVANVKRMNLAKSMHGLTSCDASRVWLHGLNVIKSKKYY